ncbi:MAG: type I restriction enzyme HsdR N-terminal domain-containing protein [Muribaculaceae bacterium]|nr:type I restriction enzyme HsdR N-terminal domain-containing protein [Muribaculaceae bacterium]
MKEEALRKLPPLCFPYGDLKIVKDESENLKVFDSLRDKFVFLTPEEFVRQNFIEWLVTHKGYPRSLMANEVSINLNNTSKRCDTVAYDRYGQPIMIVEYKAPDVEITQDTFDQIVRYNMELKAKYLTVTNGRGNYCCRIDYERNTYHFIKEIPNFENASTLEGMMPN